MTGLLDLGSTSYLISISRREQVARIRGDPVYTITDVALIPISSHAEAKQAIDAAAKTQTSGKAPSGDETDESDVGEEDDTKSLSEQNAHPEDAAAVEPSKEGLLGKGTSIVKSAVKERGQYIGHARKWLNRGTRKVDDTPTQSGGDTGDQPDLTLEQRQHAAQSLPDDKDQKEAETELAANVADEPASSDEGKAEQTEPSSPPKQKSTIETLRKRILRNAHLYLSSSSFFFSYDYDLSVRMSQQSSAPSKTPLHQRFERIFFWNQHLVQPFVSAGQDRFVLPLLQGFVGQRTFSLEQTESGQEAVVSEAADNAIESVGAQATATTTESGKHDFVLTLISRRSVKRAGLRYLRRGIDDEGNVANCVETEQILSPQDWSLKLKTFSFLQIRGSIPLFYTQSPYSFKPLPQTFGSETTNHVAFKKHFTNLAQRYGKIQVANLVDKHGTEVGIGESYEQTAKWLNEYGGVNGTPIGFEWFDFHHECKGMRFENVSILIDTLEGSLRSSGWAVKQNGELVRQQHGILRTNCMDCLDRTNVTQSSAAGWVLQQQLAELGLLIDLRTDPKSIWFNQLWADNGDAISKQYAGTAALKGDFTRTRKRNWTGALSDFSLTLNRYYNNIFGDYFLQTCIDYLLGYVGPDVFDDFETNLTSQDYALDMRRIRRNAIDVCAKIVLENPKEHLLGGWTLSCPREANTVRTSPFEECVLLLTDAAMYFCRFDWNSEKVGSFERAGLTDVTEVWRGPYITSILGPTQMDETKNVGFAFKYNTHGDAIVRTNTRSLANEKPAEDENKGKDEVEKQATPQKEDRRLLAFKMLPPKSSTSQRETEDSASLSEREMLERISDEIHQAMSAAFGQPQAGETEEVPKIEEKAVISVAEARKSTGYIESLGYSLKKLVW